MYFSKGIIYIGLSYLLWHGVVSGPQEIRMFSFRSHYNNNNNNLFNVYTYNDCPYILIFNFVILYNTRIYVRVTLSLRAVSETDRVPFILTVLFALHLH